MFPAEAQRGGGAFYLPPNFVTNSPQQVPSARGPRLPEAHIRKGPGALAHAGAGPSSRPAGAGKPDSKGDPAADTAGPLFCACLSLPPGRRGPHAQLQAVLGHRPPGHEDAPPLQEAAEGLVAEGLPGVLLPEEEEEGLLYRLAGDLAAADGAAEKVAEGG